MLSTQVVLQIALVGIVATAVMDVWLLLLARWGVPATSFALVGRWVGHFTRGRFSHVAIARTEPLRYEQALGWSVHYIVGIAYAGLLVAAQGLAWLKEPSAVPAVVFGVATVAAPWLVMQPAMGAGWAGAKTPSPRSSRVRSLANHTVFGIGLYLAASALQGLWP